MASDVATFFAHYAERYMPSDVDAISAVYLLRADGAWRILSYTNHE